jgi:GDP-4-dehydro-6-deoxy-D-mannose reductase
MKCLITGANGFIGWHLAAYLQSCGQEVSGFGEAVAASAPGVTWYRGSVLDRAALAQTLRQVRPDLVFHLAAKSLPVRSWENPASTFSVNVEGTLNLYDAVRAEVPSCRIVTAGSSAEYGVSPHGEPIREDAVLAPSSPYGVSKLAVSHLSRLYHAAYGLDIIVVRPFFLIGTRKTGDICSDFARGIVAIERGGAETLRVGNLEAVRDLMDVRDGVRAFRVLAQRGLAGQCYNICRGEGTRMADVLKTYEAMAGVPVRVHKDPSLMRPVDEPVKVGCAERLLALGWKPCFGLEDSLRTILDYWRSQPV